MSTLLDSSRPNVTVTNTSSETAVYTVTIPGGTLGTDGMVYAVLMGKKVKNGGGVDSAMELHVYLDGTQIGALHPTNVGSDDSAGISLKAEVYLAANGSTSAQTVHFILSGSTTAATGDPGWIKELYGTASKDSTGDLDLEFRWVQAATPDHSYTSEHGVVLAV